MEGASTTHKEDDDGQAPRLLDAPVKIQDQEGNDREGLDFMWGTDKVRGNSGSGVCPRQGVAKCTVCSGGVGKEGSEGYTYKFSSPRARGGRSRFGSGEQ